MGACFQAPRATPGQRQMETYLGKIVVTVHHLFQNCPTHLHWCVRWSWNWTVGGFLQYFTQMGFRSQQYFTFHWHSH